jgi:hypothetical protein
VHKGSTQTNKKIEERIQIQRSKETECALVWRTGLSGMPSDSVRCTRTIQSPTCHSRVSQGALRYNSSDCPVCHQTVRCTSEATATSRNGQLQKRGRRATMMNSARRVRAAHQRRTEHCPMSVRCGTGLSGATRGQSLQRSEALEP